MKHLTDNPINRTILVTFMKKKKIKFDIASNGKEAVEKWQSGEFHLILVRYCLIVKSLLECGTDVFLRS
jgi:CheY-like chemotaxis protein